MDRETLERLLLDRALGGLPAETEALLTAYLASNTSASASARSWGETAALARRAVADDSGADDSAVTLPAFPAEKMWRAARGRVRGRRLRYGGGLAACLLLGIGLRGLWPSATPTGAGEARIVYRGLDPLPPARGAEEDPGGGFWSVAALRERASRPGRDRSGRLIWDSPVSRPRRGDAL